MPGIFVTRGSSLRIPAGGLILPLDGSEPPPVQIELLLELWDRWLEISGTETVAAEAAHRRLLDEISTGGEGRGPALEAEFNAALLATASSAFAVDAFYAAVKERIPPHPHAVVWAKNRTPREKRIVEVFKDAFALKPGHSEQIAPFLRALFTCEAKPSIRPPSTSRRATTTTWMQESNGVSSSSLPKRPEQHSTTPQRCFGGCSSYQSTRTRSCRSGSLPHKPC